MADFPDLPYYKGWEEERVWQLAELFERAMGLPKILDARRIISRYPPTQIVYATPPISHCRDLLDWNSLRPSLMLLYERQGDVHFELGGHDDFRNIWFHCVRMVRRADGKLGKQLAGIFFVIGSSRPISRL